MSSNPTLRAYLCLTFTAFCWGGNSVLAKLAVGEVSPLLLVTLRWFGAVLLLCAFARRPIRRDWTVVKQHVPILFVMGALGFTVFNALFYWAAYTTTALNIGIIQGSIPVLVLLGGLIIFGAAVTGMQSFGVVVTMIGVVVVVAAGELQRLTSLTINQGDYLMVIACILYSGYVLALKRFADISPLSLFAVIAFAAVLSSLPLSFGEYLLGDLQWPTFKGWIIVTLITLLPSFLAQIFFIQGVADIGTGRAGIFVNLVPIFAAILSVLILREDFQYYHGVGLLMVVFGIWLSEQKSIMMRG